MVVEIPRKREVGELPPIDVEIIRIGMVRHDEGIVLITLLDGLKLPFRENPDRGCLYM